MHAKLLQSCPILCDPMDHRLPGFSVHGPLQARILEWVAMPPSREASQPGSQSCDEICHSSKCRLFDSPLFCMCSLHGLSTPLQSNILRAQLPCRLPWRLPREPQQMETCIPTVQVLTSVKAVLAQDDLSSLRALSPSDTMRSRSWG